MEELNCKKETLPYTFEAPDLESEIGEIERVANKFDPTNKARFILAFLQEARSAPLVELSDQLWRHLDNTDSFQFGPGDWESVARHADYYKRDWQLLKQKMESGKSVGAPIVVKVENQMHLVSGNTRLMIARALGIRPKVLLVDMAFR